MRIGTLMLVAALLATATPSGAKSVCGKLGDPDGRFYVILKVKTKVGTVAPALGYFVTPAGVSTTFSGHYSMTSVDTLILTTLDGLGANGGEGTNLRNWSASTTAAAGEGAAYGTNVNGAVTTEIPPLTTTFLACSNVPKFGVPD